MKISVADYITEKMYEAGCGHVFLITGGMIMHLTDALLRHKKMKYICCHHEQAATMAAEAYGRYTGRLGVAYVTAGPGALNTVTGVVGAYVDSSPCIIVAGQSKAALAKAQESEQQAQAQATAAAQKLTEAEAQKKSSDGALAKAKNQADAATTAAKSCFLLLGEHTVAKSTVWPAGALTSALRLFPPLLLK